MKRMILIFAAVCLMATVAMAQEENEGLKGTMLFNAYGGYTIGMGDAFDDVKTAIGENSTSATLNFGGNFHYGVAPKILVGIDIMGWMYKWEFTPAANVPGHPATDETNMQMAIMGSALYQAYVSEKQDAFLNAGFGVHMLDGGGDTDKQTEIAAMAGGFYRYWVSPTVGVFVMPRVHFVFADDMFEIIQISAGVSIPFGGK